MKSETISIKKVKQKNKIENKRKCDNCRNAEKTYRMIYMDGKKMKDLSICLNCGAGMPALFI